MKKTEPRQFVQANAAISEFLSPMVNELYLLLYTYSTYAELGEPVQPITAMRAKAIVDHVGVLCALGYPNAV